MQTKKVLQKYSLSSKRKGYTSLPFGAGAELYTEGIANEKKEEGSENEIIKIPNNTKLAAKMNQEKEKNNKNKRIY